MDMIFVDFTEVPTRCKRQIKNNLINVHYLSSHKILKKYVI